MWTRFESQTAGSKNDFDDEVLLAKLKIRLILCLDVCLDRAFLGRATVQAGQDSEWGLDVVIVFKVVTQYAARAPGQLHLWQNE